MVSVGNHNCNEAGHNWAIDFRPVFYATWGDRQYIIENTSIMTCLRCGEQFYTPKQVYDIETKLKDKLWEEELADGPDSNA